MATTVVGVERVGGLDTLARVGTALSDGTRRRILVRLLAGPAYPAELVMVASAPHRWLGPAGTMVPALTAARSSW